MAFSESLAGPVRQCPSRRENVEEQKTVGGVGFLPHGNTPVGVRKDSPNVRLGPDQRGMRCWSRPPT
jgi:hypothetical protein